MTDASARTSSAFVTVLAWVGLLVSGFSTLIGGLQAVVMRTLPHGGAFADAAADSAVAARFPAPAVLALRHLTLAFVLGWALSAYALVASFGLLRRRNWARLSYVALLALGICWNLGALVVQQRLYESMAIPAGRGPDAAQLAAVFRMMHLLMTTLTLAMTAVFIWLVAKLLSNPVRREFAPRAHPAAAR
jgi:uncharacterized membrane protein YhdT